MAHWLSLPILALSLALPPGGAAQKYIQDSYKMAPAKAGALNTFLQAYAMQCRQQAGIKEVKAFERTKAFKYLHERSSTGSAIGFSVLQQAMADHGESIDCGK